METIFIRNNNQTNVEKILLFNRKFPVRPSEKEFQIGSIGMSPVLLPPNSFYLTSSGSLKFY